MTALPDIDWNHHPFPDGVPPHWARGWGEDKFGVFVEIWVGKISQRLRWIPPGRFLMGSPETEEERLDAEGPQHEVTFETGFWLGDTPVTQEFWYTITGTNPANFQDDIYQGTQRPIEQVSWHDAQDFISKLNGDRTGLSLSLPSEAQWEYACRAGTTSARYGEKLNDIGWYRENSDKTTHPVKQKDPNAFGLYDMLGNVWEWCQDDWHKNYVGAPTTGSAWKAEASASEHRPVIRGGSWFGRPRDPRSAFRFRLPADGRGSHLGFRLALGQG